MGVVSQSAPAGDRPPAAADIVLTHGYFLEEDAHERKHMKPYPPLGLLYLSAFLKRAGFAPIVVDTTFADRAALWACLEARMAPVLGIYTNLLTRAAVLEIVARARQAGWTIVLGGPEAANHVDAYLAHGADVVVIGEGELTLAALLPAIAAGGAHRLHAVAGIAFRDEVGTVVRTPARPSMRNLDALPWPDREAVDLHLYLDCWHTHHGLASLNLITARGCPYTCRWCSHAVFGFGHARRSPDAVADEVAWIHARYGPDRLWYADDVFSINHRWLGSFAATMRARGLAIPFECITRADRVDAEIAEILQRLGCERVWLGSESGSQRVLDAMSRGVTVDQVRASTRLLQAAGIQVGMFLMWGYEVEGHDDVAATIAHVKRTLPDVFLTTVAYPIAGTPYHADVGDRLVAPADWASATDRDHRVRGRRSRRYYGFATDRLRHEVALHRLRQAGLSPGTVGAAVRAAAGAARARRHAPCGRRGRGVSHAAGGPLDRASTPAPAGILAAPGPPSGTFDAVADRYDARFTHHPVGRAVRAAVWRHLDTAFGPGARVADLGCGTGADAVHLARRGADVTAIDASPAMLAVARRNAAAAGVGDRVRLVQARIEDLASTDLVGAALDGAIADFGSLNCLSALSVRRLGRDLGHCLRRGGPSSRSSWGRRAHGRPYGTWRIATHGGRSAAGEPAARRPTSAAGRLSCAIRAPGRWPGS